MTTCACGNCQFFDEAKVPAKQTKDDSGLCRFNPPAPQQAGQHGAWPVVGRNDWCGHFAATVERFMTAAE